MQYLRQSTTATIQLGPFVDETDGFTVEDGLTITQADIRVSKSGAAFVQASDPGAAAHDENGWYRKVLDSTDTNTLGRTIVAVHEGGARPVQREFMVITANNYDSLVTGADNLWVDTVLIEGADPTDTIRDSVTDDATRLDASAVNAITADLTDGGRLDLLIDDILDDTGELQTDDVPGLIGALNDPTVDDILDEVVEGTYTMRQVLRLCISALAGKCSGGGTTTITFRDSGDGTDRIIATVDANGNRTAVTLDVS